jgi:hypothetical protein
MATTALGLALQISASTAGLAKSVNEVNQKLDSMAEAGKKSAKDLAILKTIEIGRALIDSAKALAGALSSAASSALDLFNNSRASVGELTTLAQVSNTSVEEFQKVALAARSVGIEQDKMADILKDVNDRIGDFIETGGGPMADFFENIAPKVGVTADEFERLSGPQALQLFVDSLEKANLSQADLTFYMEAMASDMTNLLPLLKDGGAGMDELAGRAERLGIVLNTDQTTAIKEMNGALGLVQATFDGIINQVTSQLAPVITDIVNKLLDMVERIGPENITQTITNALFSFADAFLGGLQTLAEVLAQIADGILKILSTLGVVEQTADERELARVREQATRTRMLPGGQFGGARQQRIFDPTEEQAARIAELEARIQMRAEGGLGQVLVGGIEGLRETLNQTREQFAQPPEAPQESVDATRGVERAVEEGSDQTVEELQGLREDFRQAPAVDILGAAP